MSRFLSSNPEYNETSHNEIDFDDAIRLPDGGSICDLYRTKWQRREVFVKRLKEEYRTNPLYLDALDKEYEEPQTSLPARLPGVSPRLYRDGLYRRNYPRRNDKT